MPLGQKMFLKNTMPMVENQWRPKVCCHVTNLSKLYQFIWKLGLFSEWLVERSKLVGTKRIKRQHRGPRDVLEDIHFRYYPKLSESLWGCSADQYNIYPSLSSSTWITTFKNTHTHTQHTKEKKIVPRPTLSQSKLRNSSTFGQLFERLLFSAIKNFTVGKLSETLGVTVPRTQDLRTMWDRVSGFLGYEPIFSKELLHPQPSSNLIK